MKITQTHVNDNKIQKNLIKISELYAEINRLREEINVLKKTYFCGKEIVYENEEVRDDYGKSYELSIYICNDFKMMAKVYRDQRNTKENTFVAKIDECGVNWHTPKWYSSEISKSVKDIKTYEKAKEISRNMLADVIEKYG